MKAPQFAWERMASLVQVTQKLQVCGWGGKVMAGGQSLGAMLNLRLAQPDTVLDLEGIDELHEVKDAGDSVVFGALVTHASIEDGKHPDPSQGLMAHVARGIAYRAVRNRGTMGGSLCHADPAADWVNTLPLLGATLTVHGSLGSRDIASKDFMRSAFETALAEDEVLTHIRVPKLSTGSRWSYQKFCRKKGEFAHALVACLHEPAAGVERIVLGALDGAPCVLEGVGLLSRLKQASERQKHWQALGLMEQPHRLAWMEALLTAALQEIQEAR